MYTPKFFELTDPALIEAFIHRWSFGELITTYQGALEISHLPLFFDAKEHKLLGHLANQNPQLNSLEHAEDLRVVFQGHNAYVSPSWYASDNMVPTWNFECVHVTGKAKILDHASLLQILAQLSDKHERQFESPWTMAKLPEKALSAMSSAITGFEINISTIQAKQKLSQNRNLEDRQGVIAGLASQADSASQAIADTMRSLEK